MPKLELLFKRSVVKDLRPLGEKDRERIFAALRRLF
jgi:mRNA-degrading endonuclease RelE of RelBE toxin-antitoxin system